MNNLLSSTAGIVIVGLVIGVVGALLQYAGNPPNMGICVACMERDVAGAIGLHQADKVQYLRPEIIGFILGGFLAAIAFGEFRARNGSSPALRFALGLFAMLGALVFLGCPWRALLRIAGGDANGLVGLAGLVAGIAVGSWFLRNGFEPGRAYPAKRPAGSILLLVAIAFLAMIALQPDFLRSSIEGPGSMRAPVAASLLLALAVGFLAQRSRFCTVGAFRDLFIIRSPHLFYGVLALLVAAFLANLALGQFHAGFSIAEGKPQPIAHTVHLWNFLGMALSGLCFVLAGGCPGRQLVLSGEGDGDAAVFVLGMLVGGGIAHNFAIAASPAGPGANGPAAVVIGLVFAVIMGFAMKEKMS